MTISSTVLSADWTYNSDISLGLEHTDNLFFTSSDSFNGDIADTFLLFVPAFSVLAESETSRTHLDFGVSVERYDKVTDADRNDPYARFNWDTIQESYSLGLGLGYVQTSTRTSELETTGQVNIFGTQTRSSIEPYWQVNVNESNRLRLGLNLQSVSYDVDLTNYDTYGLLAGWFYDYSEAHTLNFSMELSHYDSEDARLDFDYGTLLAGMEYNASEALNLSLSIGVGYGVREDEDNYTSGLLNASLIFQQEYYSTSLILSSNLVPSGQADLRQVHALTFAYDQQISESIDFNLNASLSESFPIDDPDGVRNEVLTVRPRLSYRMAQDWYFDTWYRYRSNRNFVEDIISENSGYVGIRWRVE
jgi:hypothetical protein